MKSRPPPPSEEIRFTNTIKKERYKPLRGTSFLNITNTTPPPGRTPEQIDADIRRRTIDLYDDARRLGDKLLEVWE